MENNLDDINCTKEELSKQYGYECKEDFNVSEIQPNNDENIISSYPSIPIIAEYVGLVNNEPLIDPFNSKQRSGSLDLDGKEKQREKGEIYIKEKGEVKD
jgi:hypothetical protein